MLRMRQRDARIARLEQETAALTVMLVDDLTVDEAHAKIEEFYQAIPDPSFSDKITGQNIHDLLRTDA